MRIFVAISLLLFLPAAAQADDNTYLVETDDGVAVNYYLGGSQDTPQQVLVDAGFEDDQVREIEKDDVPGDLEQDRDFWYWNPAKNKIEVDKTAKKAYEDKVEAEEAKRDAILDKLKSAVPGMTDEDLEYLDIKKPVKVKKKSKAGVSNGTL